MFQLFNLLTLKFWKQIPGEAASYPRRKDNSYWSYTTYSSGYFWILHTDLDFDLGSDFE